MFNNTLSAYNYLVVFSLSQPYFYLFFIVIVDHRGLPGAKKVPFRKWYGCLGELRSLIPKKCQMIVLTATATKQTKQQIWKTLHLSENEMKIIEQSPDRPNLFYVKSYLEKSENIEAAFSSLICEVKELNTKTDRTLIYCQTRKQCSVLFRVFEVYLGNYLYHLNVSPKNRIVEMYHAGTPTSAKNHISKSMSTDDGNVRVLICTVAFGMGVNCKRVRRVIHFGPSKSVELYVQECGRAGRDGLPSTCVLLYNGLLSSYCDSDIKQYVQIEQCRRKWLMDQFGCKGNHSNLKLHDCCDFCAAQCKCGNDNCGKFWSPCEDRVSLPELIAGTYTSSTTVRTVTKQDRENLQKKLLELQQDMRQQVQVNTMVCPNFVLEFNMFHINQVMESCHKLFTVDDILQSVEIWRHHHAKCVLKVLNDVFGDVDIESLCFEENSLDNTIASDWGEIRDDSALVSMLDSQDLEGIDSFMDSIDNDTGNSFCDASGASNLQ